MAHQGTARSKQTRRTIPRQGLVGAIGGFAAGTLVGLTETLLLALFTGEWWGCLEAIGYAVTVYGLLCAVSGMLCGLGWGLWIVWRRRGPSTWPIYALMVLIAPFGVTTITRVEQDLFGGALLDRAIYLWVFVLLILIQDLAFVGLAVGMRRASTNQRFQTLARPGRGLALGLALLLTTVGLSYGLVPLIDALQPATPSPSGIGPDLIARPNVIVFLADALRADRLGCYGNRNGLTPHIDDLARDGIVYRNTTAQAPWTKPSVATLLTSMYPTSHRVIQDESLLPEAVIALPEILSAAGYRTVAFSSNPYISPTFNFHQGFDEFYLLEGKRFGAPRMARQLTIFNYATGLLYLSFWYSLPIPLWPQDRYQEIARLNEHVTHWIEVNRESRFFMYIHYMDPHDPYFEHPYNGYAQPAGHGYLDRNLTPELNRLYDGEVAYLDTHIGRLLEMLKSQGLYDDTLIIFTADHGEEFDEHGGFFHGDTLYQELIAVPLVVKYPGNVHRGLVDETSARCLDIAPTVLDVTGLPIPAIMQGLSLLPGTSERRADQGFSETVRWGTVGYCFHDEQYKLIIANEDNPRGLPTIALFDLQADPGERHNILADEPDIARRLRVQLDQVMAFAEANAVAGQTIELDPATRERLRQLGY